MDAVELAANAGLDLDGWQARALEVGLGERADGKWAAREVALICPRQNGKGSVLEALVLAGMFLFGEELILWSAHEFKTASEAFLRVWQLVEGSDDLERRVSKVYRAHGSEGIELKGGQRLRFVARTGGSGRGFSGDRIVLDEAFNLSDRSVSALAFTMAARQNPQVWYTSSAPLPSVESDVLRRLCRRGRQGDDRLAYMEFCADSAVDPGDVEAWAAANPGFPHRISEETISVERQMTTEEDFARERLGVWRDGDLLHTVIPQAPWNDCAARGHEPSGQLRYALDVDTNSKGEEWASVGVSDGVHCEVVTPPEVGQGTDWVVPAVVAKRGVVGELVLDPQGPAGKLLAPLENAGIPVRKVTVQEFSQASQQFFDAVTGGQVRHIDQPRLNRAAAGAQRKDMGDGAWKFSRKLSPADISPLVAVVLARWLASSDAGSVYESRAMTVL